MPQKNINHTYYKRTNSAIEFVRWPVYSSIIEKNMDEKILALQTTRIAPNGFSSDQTSPYQGFNLGLHVGDSTLQVEKNRSHLQSLLPEHTKIQWFEQVHGHDVAEILHVSKKTIIADAAVTREKNICLAIMTADCLPILLVSKSGDEIAAIHGGWRPLAANIISNTLNKMKTPAEDLIAWLGPCISKNVFEVGSEVKEMFTKEHNYFDSAFSTLTPGKYLADLHKIAKFQLEDLGVNEISSLPECTFSNKKYYSYRKNSMTGRMVTLICIL